jgi:hypothetical protein
MPRKRLVIDASVAGAAGNTEHPISKANRDFLRQVLSVCHKVVMTPEISLEWKAHQSRFSSLWRTSMTAHKKVVETCGTDDPDLRSGIDRCGLREKQRAAIHKDIHLVEAALLADRIVISGDGSARHLFCMVSSDVPLLKSVVWVNPAQPPADLQQWLERGGRPVKEWQLRPP